MLPKEGPGHEERHGGIKAQVRGWRTSVWGSRGRWSQKGKRGQIMEACHTFPSRLLTWPWMPKWQNRTSLAIMQPQGGFGSFWSRKWHDESRVLGKLIWWFYPGYYSVKQVWDREALQGRKECGFWCYFFAVRPVCKVRTWQSLQGHTDD